MIKKIALSISLFFLFVFVPQAFAHVIVKPSQAGVASTVTFDMGVPNEKDTPTVGMRLLIPDGLAEVVPDVKSGWSITVKKNGDSVTEIDWTGGSIPPSQRDQFYFSAQVPAKETTLNWKAYQMYQDGSTVAWVNTPSKDPMDDKAPPPYSTTNVINDLTKNAMMSPSSQPVPMNDQNVTGRVKLLMVLTGISLLLSLAAIGLALRKK